jgi:hypothetical protein
VQVVQGSPFPSSPSPHLLIDLLSTAGGTVLLRTHREKVTESGWTKPLTFRNEASSYPPSL